MSKDSCPTRKDLIKNYEIYIKETTDPAKKTKLKKDMNEKLGIHAMDKQCPYCNPQ